MRHHELLSEFVGLDDASNITAADLANEITRRGLDLRDMTLDYAGCGTHEMMVTWEDGQPTPPPPPPTPEEIAQERADRELGF